MRNKKAKALELLLGLGLGSPVKRLHDRGRSPLVVLAYHRVLPLPRFETYPFDLELISASPERFDAQMRYIATHFDPVPLSAIVDHVVSGARLPPRPVAVTFDDGYDDNLIHAGPVLARYGIVPTIFLATDYVGRKTPYWFERAMYLMMRLPPGALHVDGIPQALPTAPDANSRRRDGHRLQRAVSSLSPDDREALFDRWSAEFAAHLDPTEYRLSGLLDWEQVRSMSRSGFEFGSHTVSHPVLSTLDPATLRRELVESRERLEREIGRVPTLAYPIGKPFAYSTEVIQATEAAGYGLALTYVGGANWLGRVPPFELKRQNIERAHDDARFAAMMAFPDWVQW